MFSWRKEDSFSKKIQILLKQINKLSNIFYILPQIFSDIQDQNIFISLSNIEINFNEMILWRVKDFRNQDVQNRIDLGEY